MHPSEKRALFLMLTAVEQQIANIKSILGSTELATAIASVPQVPRGTMTSKEAAATSYLSDSEEEEHELEMERIRQQMLKENEIRVQAAWGDEAKGAPS